MSPSSPSSPASLALAEMAKLGSVYHPSCADEVPVGEFVYLVSNGENILQLGKGDNDRVKKCTRGGLAGKHNKAFICAVGELVLGRPNSYALLRVQSKDCADVIEKKLQTDLGITRNKDGATLITGVDARSIVGIHEALWTRAKSTNAYRALDSVEQLMVEEMFEIATYATSRILRSSGRLISSKQADNLEGNILMNLGRRHLANIFMKLTGQYLRYRSTHRLTDDEFASMKFGYTYVPKEQPFVVTNTAGLAT
ncbi:MAG TPA: hypothetical protein VE057_05900 [Archangium sp.]|nr:hypothetical protein [Archangium sp.]